MTNPKEMNSAEQHFNECSQNEFFGDKIRPCNCSGRISPPLPQKEVREVSKCCGAKIEEFPIPCWKGNDDDCPYYNGCSKCRKGHKPFITQEKEERCGLDCPTRDGYRCSRHNKDFPSSATTQNGINKDISTKESPKEEWAEEPWKKSYNPFKMFQWQLNQLNNWADLIQGDKERFKRSIIQLISTTGVIEKHLKEQKEYELSKTITESIESERNRIRQMIEENRVILRDKEDHLPNVYHYLKGKNDLRNELLSNLNNKETR